MSECQFCGAHLVLGKRENPGWFYAQPSDAENRCVSCQRAYQAGAAAEREACIADIRREAAGMSMSLGPGFAAACSIIRARGGKP